VPAGCLGPGRPAPPATQARPPRRRHSRRWRWSRRPARCRGRPRHGPCRRQRRGRWSCGHGGRRGRRWRAPGRRRPCARSGSWRRLAVPGPGPPRPPTAEPPGPPPWAASGPADPEHRVGIPGARVHQRRPGRLVAPVDLRLGQAGVVVSAGKHLRSSASNRTSATLSTPRMAAPSNVTVSMSPPRHTTGWSPTPGAPRPAQPGGPQPR
jgi:hypothetical protein